VDARDADQLRADWGISYLELRALPPGPERDAMVKRCVELAKAFERSFRRMGPGDVSEADMHPDGGIAKALNEHLIRRKMMILDAIDADPYIVRVGPPGGPWTYEGVGSDRAEALSQLVVQFDDLDRGWPLREPAPNI
jgi:hypothetical protein